MRKIAFSLIVLSTLLITSCDLFSISCFSFNYQFRFNNNHEYNNPFGRNRSHFSETMKNNLIRFVKKIQKVSAQFVSYDFTDFPIDNLTKNDFVY